MKRLSEQECSYSKIIKPKYRKHPTADYLNTDVAYELSRPVQDCNEINIVESGPETRVKKHSNHTQSNVCLHSLRITACCRYFTSLIEMGIASRGRPGNPCT